MQIVSLQIPAPTHYELLRAPSILYILSMQGPPLLQTGSYACGVPNSIFKDATLASSFVCRLGFLGYLVAETSHHPGLTIMLWPADTLQIYILAPSQPNSLFWGVFILVGDVRDINHIYRVLEVLMRTCFD